MKLNLRNYFLCLLLPLFCRRESVSNHTLDTPAAREAAVANAVEPGDAIDFSDEAGGWFKISPYGVFRGVKPGRLQYVNEESAKRMVAEFNSVRGRLGRLFRGSPIYHGHPDVDPTIWPDDRRLGPVNELEARADGLWGRAEWNSLGLDNKREGWWIYPSPRWDAPAGQDRFEPDRLISVGLTNTPRIQESEPVFNSDSPSPTTETTTNETMDPKLIRQKLGLEINATDEEVLAKIESLAAAASENDSTKTALETANQEKAEMANSLRAAEDGAAIHREAANNSLLDLAERDLKISKADRPAWQAKLNGDKREDAVNSLAQLKPKFNSKQLDLTDRRGERKSADGMREQVANAVSALQKDKGISYDQAWSTVKNDKQYAAYFDRSEG